MVAFSKDFSLVHSPSDSAICVERISGQFSDMAESRGQKSRMITGKNGRFPYDSCQSPSLAQGTQQGERGFLGRAWDSVAGASKWVYNKATGWHFEGRSALNGSHPTYAEVTVQGSKWILLPKEQAIYHDNNLGQPELKYIHPDGREAVFSMDQTGSYEPYMDPQFMPTYNYVNPGQVPSNWYDVGGWVDFGIRGVGHMATDVIPYYMGGNIRGDDPGP